MPNLSYHLNLFLAILRKRSEWRNITEFQDIDLQFEEVKQVCDKNITMRNIRKLSQGLKNK